MRTFTVRPFTSLPPLRVVAGACIAAIALSACTSPAVDEGSSGTTTVNELADPTANLLTTGWIVGEEPFAELDLGETPFDQWPETFASFSDAQHAPRVLLETARTPDVCTAWRVTVKDVTFGDGPASERMRQGVFATLEDINHAPGPLLSPDDTPWCDGMPREALAWYAAFVTPSFCDLPQMTLTCVTVTSMRYDGGAHSNIVHSDLVFDRETGAQLGADEILARQNIGPAPDWVVETAVCTLDRNEELQGADDCWPISIRNLRPTLSGAVFSFAPYESGPYALGSRTLFIPWEVLALSASTPPAAAEVHRKLLTAMTYADWTTLTALAPTDGSFEVAIGEFSPDPIAVLRALPRDPHIEIAAALALPPAPLGDMWVWPAVAVRDRFTLSDVERASLSALFDEESVVAWEKEGRYSGWRVGISRDGAWRFVVAGS